MTPIKLRPASYMVLGMVNLGARSGYAIKKAADISTAAFWPTSLAQVYPELERLEQGGLLVRRDDPQGARRRSSYELTDEGRSALLSWLRSFPPSPHPAALGDDVAALLRRRAAAAPSSWSWSGGCERAPTAARRISTRATSREAVGGFRRGRRPLSAPGQAPGGQPLCWGGRVDGRAGGGAGRMQSED